VGAQAIPVFTISLARSPERRSAQERHLHGLGIEFEPFDAIDGKLLSGDELSRISARNDLPIGAVGCYLSHIRLYERIVANAIPVACILEDDGRLRPNALRILRNGCSSPNFDLCFLDSDDRNSKGVVCFDKDSRNEIAPGVFAYSLSDGPHCLHAYLITLAGAQKRLTSAFPIRECVDQYEFSPVELHFRAVLFPRSAFVSRLSRASTTLDRAGHGTIPLYRWRSAPGFYAVRDLLKGRALERWIEMRRKQRTGELSRTRRWRPLPAGREIMPE
jgi:glycosyl transferase family 25